MTHGPCSYGPGLGWKGLGMSNFAHFEKKMKKKRKFQNERLFQRSDQQFLPACQPYKDGLGRDGSILFVLHASDGNSPVATVSDCLPLRPFALAPSQRCG